MSSVFKNIFPQENKPIRTINGLYGSARGYVLAKAWEEHPQHTFVVILPTETDAQALLDDVALFLSDQTHDLLPFYRTRRGSLYTNGS